MHTITIQVSRLCSIPDCGRPHKSRGYCNQHYLRYQRYGNPLGRSPTKRKVVTWLKKNSFHNKDECLEWPFSKSNGYGQCNDYLGVGKGAHRNMCFLAHGKPPTPKHHAAHSCRSKSCVAPRHLSWKTVKENAEDRLRDGTLYLTKPKTKLTEADVQVIRKLRGVVSGYALAARFNVTPSCISGIHLGKSWRWLL